MARWEQNPIGQAAGAPPAAGDPMCFAWLKNKTQHVVYRGTDNQVHELWTIRAESYRSTVPAGTLRHLL